MELGLLFFLLSFVPGLRAQLSSSASPWGDPCLPHSIPQLLSAQGPLTPDLAGLAVGSAGSIELMVDYKNIIKIWQRNWIFCQIRC